MQRSINKLEIRLLKIEDYPLLKESMMAAYADMENAYWKEKFDKRTNPFGKDYYWLTGTFVNLDKGEDTDEWALENGYVSVVPVQFDLTAHHYIQNLILSS